MLQSPAAPQVSAPPAAPGAPAASGAPASEAARDRFSVQPLSAEQAAFLRTRRDALSNQLESVQERRNEVADQLRSDETQAAERPGLQDRLRVLDERLVQIEKDIASNSEQLANAPARGREGTTVPANGGRGFPVNVNGNLLTIFSFALLMPFAIQLARRLFSPNRRPSRRELGDLAAMQQRMNAMDGAIDAVALEVERIGEGQRFLTQAMVGNGLPTGAPAPEGVPVRERRGVELG